MSKLIAARPDQGFNPVDLMNFLQVYCQDTTIRIEQPEKMRFLLRRGMTKVVEVTFSRADAESIMEHLKAYGIPEPYEQVHE